MDDLPRFAFLLVCAALIIVCVAAYVGSSIDCSRRGGIIVRTAMSYQCIKVQVIR